MSDQDHMYSSVIPDFRGISDPNDMERRFYQAAKAILLGCDLKRDAYCWQITALELYLYYQPIWCDPTTHGKRFNTREQLKSSTWYIHRDGKLPLRRLGIDITAGCETPEIHAGLLIAAIDDNDGSGRAMKSILRGRCDNGSWGYEGDEKQFCRTIIHRSGVWSDKPNLRLERRQQPRPGTLWVGKRKGLDKRQVLEDRYKNALLRVAVSPPCEDWKSHRELQMRPLNP